MQPLMLPADEWEFAETLDSYDIKTKVRTRATTHPQGNDWYLVSYQLVVYSDNDPGAVCLWARRKESQK